VGIELSRFVTSCLVRGGEMENRIKEQPLGLFTGRTSCHGWWANQFRRRLSSRHPYQALLGQVLKALGSG
jgi:hypothetical protein